MTVTPMEYVAAPPLTPPRFGILSAAVVIDSPNPHIGFGFQYVPDFCGPARMTVGVCADPSGQKVSESGRDVVDGQPFVVYSLSDCKTIGNTDAQARAERALTAGEGRAVEEWLAARLTAEATNIGAWTGVDKALAMLEHYIACNYGGAGTIHMDRAHASLLGTTHLVASTGGRLTTMLGNVVSAGCYDDTDPLGPSTMWATGTVTLERGPVGGPGNPVLDPATNDLFALAERPYAGAWECFAVAVGVTP